MKVRMIALAILNWCFPVAYCERSILLALDVRGRGDVPQRSKDINSEKKKVIEKLKPMCPQETVPVKELGISVFDHCRVNISNSMSRTGLYVS